MSELNPLEALAKKCEQAALELELAAKHMHTMANHFRNKEVPRAGAHSLASLGHVEKAKVLFTEIAIQHASKATP